ncbi:MAG: hypothetical protein JRJ49_09465 [Deltaproteobacteria bacterium]|nr:hypothetical protein [Deltaproteobacteria bacterium]
MARGKRGGRTPCPPWNPVKVLYDKGGIKNNGKKDKIISSRLNSVKLLRHIIESIKPAPKTFLSASAIGYYGNSKDIRIKEDALPGKNFIAEVCRVWENAASKISKKIPIRTVLMRIGVVFTPAGGALKRLILPFKI